MEPGAATRHEPRPGTAKANGVQFAYLEAGPADGPLALCLHGFPDTALTWRHLLPVLAEAGYHAVAPWMRGYAPTEVPADGAYEQGALAADACALHEELGGDGRAVLIGHDWGAAAAYGAGAYQPDRWRAMVTMSMPPLGAMTEAFFSYDQLRRSFYVFLFQLPLAEMALALDGLSFIDRLWGDWSPGYEAASDIAGVKEALAAPENIEAALGYYRAMFDPARHVPQYADARAAAGSTAPQPTLYLHGDYDGCLSHDTMGDVLAHLATGSQRATVKGAGHFLHLEQPDTVGELVLDFLGR
ncbi:MAG TPA: alpha/beta hydrolase [Acidimicrobiales bacterium]|nr:alpha/beta hydrolase [Acidimicrobiales bacterium]